MTHTARSSDTRLGSQRCNQCVADYENPTDSSIHRTVLKQLGHPGSAHNLPLPEMLLWLKSQFTNVTSAHSRELDVHKSAPPPAPPTQSKVLAPDKKWQHDNVSRQCQDDRTMQHALSKSACRHHCSGRWRRHHDRGSDYRAAHDGFRTGIAFEV